MKVVVNSVWMSSGEGQPNIYLSLEPESETERSLTRSLYYCRPKVLHFTDGKLLLDFYPKKVKK